MEDDTQVDRFTVKTDALLDVGENTDHRKAQLVVTVDVRPTYVTTFNLSFAS